MPDLNRYKIIRISPILIHKWFSQGTAALSVVSDPLPDDAILLSARLVSFCSGQVLELMYQSDSWPLAPVGQPCDELMPLFKIKPSPALEPSVN